MFPSLLSSLRSSLVPSVSSSSSRQPILAFQRACGVQLIEYPSRDAKLAALSRARSGLVDVSPSSNYLVSIGNWILYYWFLGAAALGNETFYILFLPGLFWFAGPFDARRIIFHWMLSYYIGQYIKDLFRLPRPLSPPVARLESHYSAEYGFPSTHSTIGFVMPATLTYLACYHPIRAAEPLIAPSLAVALTLVWTSSVTLSRLYVGVHCVPDLIGGLLIGFFILGLGISLGDLIDGFITSAGSGHLLALLLVCWMFILIYPWPRKWTNAYGDTTLTIGVFYGVALASSTYFPSYPGQDYSQPLLTLLTCFLFRLLLGSSLMVTSRFVVKLFLLPVLTRLGGVPRGENPLHWYRVEIPLKFVNYACLGFHACFSIPALFDYIGI